MSTGLAADTLLAVRDLRTLFSTRHETVTPVDGVTFSLKRGQTLAVVGESGSGKSVTSLSIMGLLGRNGRVSGGEILYRDRQQQVHNLRTLTHAAYRRIRGAEIAMIFQEPMTSLNPLFTVGDQIAEMLRLHQPMERRQARERARQMLERVEIPAASARLDDYPHHLSGGMRQRVMIAMALACNPSLLITDEPTTALDVTIQAQILDLLRRLQAELGMSIVFITHNLGVVAEIAHDVVVMYAGRVVEHAPVEKIFRHQRHPYTRCLMACTPNPRRDIGADVLRRRLDAIPGSVPTLSQLPPGCAFATRCPLRQAACQQEVPALLPVGETTFSRCLRREEL
ncbi:ABC transporter ATP-binding protein [Candidatus Sodalis endolongispinus]|uniref:ABC-type dipeptide transporter n=1 Tax=Candidatus Sodalis endolongispinus TaxID=2812662 RepID=A0ABS5YD48_9GAMM|nr:ABC transporter ATP-binding protein [Candidatus Sodalis endolongispinus]MBT9432873.1 ABC transporter ATP-binding protein [Candidatus Sodalis endolongispinus]